MFDYNGCTKCGAQWPERMGLECRVCEKPTKGTIMKAIEVYATIKANIAGKNEAKQKAVAEAVRRIVACLVTKESLGPHTFSARNLECDDLHELAAALRRDGFEAVCSATGGGAPAHEIRVSVPEMGGPK